MEDLVQEADGGGLVRVLGGQDDAKAPDAAFVRSWKKGRESVKRKKERRKESEGKKGAKGGR